MSRALLLAALATLGACSSTSSIPPAKTAKAVDAPSTVAVTHADWYIVGDEGATR